MWLFLVVCSAKRTGAQEKKKKKKRKVAVRKRVGRHETNIPYQKSAKDSLARAQLIDGGDHLVVQLLVKLGLLGLIPAGDVSGVKHLTSTHTHTDTEEKWEVCVEVTAVVMLVTIFRPSCQWERENQVVCACMCVCACACVWCTFTRVGVACRMPCVSLNPRRSPDTA